MPKPTKLTDKQRAFVAEYLVDLNATQAAIRAGYSAKTAYSQGERLLRNVEVSKAVIAAQEKRAQRTEITQDYVLNGIRDTVERCQQYKPVFNMKGERVYVETPDGEMAAAFVFDSKSVLKGFELLGKHIGMFRGDSGSDDEPMPVKIEISVQDGRKHD